VLDPLPLRIDVDRDADPVSGRVWAGDGPERSFAGWTELFAALQDAVANHEEPCRRTTEAGRKQP
jgi:hypothetical protein